ncbi:unnamed protein product [Lymnaea stagnalis]|uniref:C-type lectin domain-containing protein n=1 Tax=Lymnaea stagnalis TaxID=6523 RepID=A0AAV2IMP2_LYMST
MYQVIPLTEARSLSRVQIEGQMSNVSRCQCGLKCHQHANCTMFFYNKIIRTCAMYGMEHTKARASSFPIAPSMEAQWRAYYLIHDCPGHSIQMKLVNKCYLVRNDLDTRPALIEHCQSLGGRLLEFSSVEELAFFKSILYRKNGNSAMSYYVGAEILINENRTFTWSNTSRTLVPSDPLWQSGHPDTMGTSDKNCVEISKTSDYALSDVSCTERKGCICEFPF